jgi:hypothetical protein
MPYSLALSARVHSLAGVTAGMMVCPLVSAVGVASACAKGSIVVVIVAFLLLKSLLGISWPWRGYSLA